MHGRRKPKRPPEAARAPDAWCDYCLSPLYKRMGGYLSKGNGALTFCDEECAADFEFTERIDVPGERDLQ